VEAVVRLGGGAPRLENLFSMDEIPEARERSPQEIAGLSKKPPKSLIEELQPPAPECARGLSTSPCSSAPAKKKPGRKTRPGKRIFVF